MEILKTPKMYMSKCSNTLPHASLLTESKSATIQKIKLSLLIVQDPQR